MLNLCQISTEEDRILSPCQLPQQIAIIQQKVIKMEPIVVSLPVLSGIQTVGDQTELTAYHK